MEAFIPIVMIIAILGFIAAIYFYNSVQQKKRTEAFQRETTELGLTFSAEGDPTIERETTGFHLTNRGRAKKYRNVIVADSDDVKVSVFDYQFTTGHGKSTRTHRQTITLVESKTFSMPSFRARPHGMLDVIGGALGFQDIDFEENVEFSNAYVLKSDDETATREFFTPRLLDFFASNQGLHFEANGNRFLRYVASRKIEAPQLRLTLEDGYKLFGALRDR